MPKALERYYVCGDLHFLAFSSYSRLPLLNTMSAGNVFVHTLGKLRVRYQFLLAGYVPEHMHLLIGETAKGTPSGAPKVLKQRISRNLLSRNRRPPAVSGCSKLRLPLQVELQTRQQSPI